MCETCEARQQLIDMVDGRTDLVALGFSVQFVDGWPPHAYTVGLTSFNHPELLMFGLEKWRLMSMLAMLAEDIRDTELAPVEAGDTITFGDWTFKAFAYPKPDDVAPRAAAAYPGSLRVLYLVYPDVHGVWPWEQHCHLFPGQQPMPGSANPETA